MRLVVYVCGRGDNMGEVVCGRGDNMGEVVCGRGSVRPCD